MATHFPIRGQEEGIHVLPDTRPNPIRFRGWGTTLPLRTVARRTRSEPHPPITNVKQHAPEFCVLPGTNVADSWEIIFDDWNVSRRYRCRSGFLPYLPDQLRDECACDQRSKRPLFSRVDSASTGLCKQQVERKDFKSVGGQVTSRYLDLR